MKLEPTEPKSKEQEPSKRPYKTPQLAIYGSVREVTRNIGPKGADDAGGGAAAGPKTGT